MNALLFAAVWLAIAPAAIAQRGEQVQPGNVTGQLFSREGKPAVGVRIAAVPVPDDDDKSSAPVLQGITQTGTDGRYKIEGLPPGRYYIFAGLIDYPNYYPGAITLEKAVALSIEAGETTPGIDFTMPRPTALIVSGRMAYPATLRPPTGQLVVMTGTTTTSTAVSMQTRIDETGSFQFPQVAPGQYRLSSTLSGTAPMALSVADRDVFDIVIPVVDCFAGVRVSGRLAGVPSSPVQSISLTGSSAGCSPVTSVKPDGSFVFSAVPPGSYRMQLSPVPLGSSAISLVVDRAEIAGMEVQLPPLIEVTGQVFIEDGSPPPRLARGNLMPIRVRGVGVRDEISQPISPDGSFRLRLIKGRYRISAPELPSGFYVKSITAESLDLMRQELDLTAQAGAEIEIALATVARGRPTGVRLSGRMKVPDAGMFPKPEGLALVAASDRRNALVLETTIKSDGSFEFIDVPPGRYNLETLPDSPIALHGIDVERTDVADIEFSMPVLVRVDGGMDWLDPQGDSLPAAPGNVSVRFARKEGDRLHVWAALVQAKDFHLYLPEGDYRFSIGNLPANFDVRAVTSGSVNVLEAGLRVKSGPDLLGVRVTLRGR